MPEGVEHMGMDRYQANQLAAFLPLMPEGVEHRF